MEAIILAGGLGTRLRSAVPDLPKCMAPINGVPFISYLIDNLINEGVTKFIFSLGYKSELFISLLEEKLPMKNYLIVIEDEPLGTGGAIKLACKKANDENAIALNGLNKFLNKESNLESSLSTPKLIRPTDLDKTSVPNIQSQSANLDPIFLLKCLGLLL